MVTIHLLRHLDRQRFKATLILLDKAGSLLSLVPDDIPTITHSFRRTSLGLVSLFFDLKRTRPHVVFSTLNHLNLLISILIPFLPSKTVFVARESSLPSSNNLNAAYPRLFNYLYKTTLRRFQSIVCQSQAMKADLIRFYSMNADKITVIYNPVDFSLVPPRTPKLKDDSAVRLISVGGLRPEKGHERLLQALGRCNTDFHYRIIGGGPLKARLQQLIIELNLQDRVELMGEIPLPYAYLSDADVLLQGSYFEGFPNAVIEAHACGTPVVAWNSPGGHHEIIIHGTNGWIIENEEQLLELITTRAFSQLRESEIIQLTASRYSVQQVVKAYEDLFQSLR
jgi:glycosyltransferase involved in cell wall biosynthesis